MKHIIVRELNKSILILSMSISNIIIGQNLDNITKKIKTVELHKIDTLVQMSKQKKSSSWLNILPDINYNLNNNTINFGISLNTFASYYQQSKRNKIEREKLKTTLTDRLENKLDKIENEYLKIQLDLESIQNEITVFELHNELFELKKNQYQNNKINLENWLEFQQSYAKIYSASISKVNTLKYRLIKLQNKVNTELPEMLTIIKIGNTLKSFSINIM